MAKKNQVAAAEPSAVEVHRPSFLKPVGDTSRGSEHVGFNDLQIPRLQIIHDLSPQRKRNEPEYIPGAEEGMMFNTVTQELYTDAVLFVPVYFRPEWVLWKNRDVGGGFISAHKTPEEAAHAYSQHPLANQFTEKKEPVIEILDTAQHFGLLYNPHLPLEDQRGTSIVISMSRSQMKPSRQFNSQINIAGGDRFERCYLFSPVQMQNNKGQDYYNWKIVPRGYVTENVYRAAEKMYEAVSSGRMDVERTTGPDVDKDAAHDTNM